MSSSLSSFSPSPSPPSRWRLVVYARPVVPHMTRAQVAAEKKYDAYTRIWYRPSEMLTPLSSEKPPLVSASSAAASSTAAAVIDENIRE